MTRTSIASLSLALVAFAPLRADNTALPPPKTPEEANLRMWERLNTAAIVANVDGDAITAEDVRNELFPFINQIRQDSKTQDEVHRRINEMSSKILDGLTERELVIRDSKEKGMNVPTSFVEEQIEEKIIRDFNGDRTEYLLALRKMGRTPMDDRRELEQRGIVDYLNAQMRKDVAEVSPEKIQRYYEANKDAFKQEAGVKLSQIALRPGAADTDEDLRKLAAVIIAKLDKGEPFAALAKQYSRDDNREQGGETPWRNITELNAELAKAVNALPVGGHTAPLEFKAGERLSLYIIRKDDVRVEGARSVAEVREIIENKLMTDAIKEAHGEWIARLRNHFFVRYYD